MGQSSRRSHIIDSDIVSSWDGNGWLASGQARSGAERGV